MKQAIKHNPEPAIGSLWFDSDGGCDYVHKYKGIDNSKHGGGRMHFVRIDFATGEENEGGTWIGYKRFLEDMVPVTKGGTKHCCGRPTLYPSIWCDDCGYETWAKARDAKEKTTVFSDGITI